MTPTVCSPITTAQTIKNQQSVQKPDRQSCPFRKCHIKCDQFEFLKKTAHNKSRTAEMTPMMTMSCLTSDAA